MADTKVTDLTAASSLAPTDHLYGVVGGNSRKVPVSLLATAADLSAAFQTANPTADRIAWAAYQEDPSDNTKAVLLGVRDDGMIVNPTFKALWEAVFASGGTGAGDLAEADSIILHGPHMFAVEGRSLEYYAPSLLPNRNRSRSSYEFTIQSVTDDLRPLGAIFKDYCRLRADDLGETARIKLKNENVGGEFVKNLTVIKSAAAKSGAPKVLMIGDSLTSQSSRRVAAIFTHTAMNPVYIGTILAIDGTTRHEGRSGWRYADLAHIDTRMGVLAEGAEADYLAAGVAGTVNPFIRVATGGDSPSIVRNGHVFDLRYYLDRFDFPDPDVVTLNLGTNDINNFGYEVGLPYCKDAAAIMISQIKAACPAAKIGLAMPMTGNNSYFNPRWYSGFAELFKWYHQQYGASSAAGIYLVSTHAMQNDRFIFPMFDGDVNSQTGQIKQTLDDGTHWDTYLGTQQYSEGLFSFIHAVS